MSQGLELMNKETSQSSECWASRKERWGAQYLKVEKRKFKAVIERVKPPKENEHSIMTESTLESLVKQKLNLLRVLIRSRKQMPQQS